MNKSVAVTSRTRGTGETASVGALGFVLADAGHSVLRVDCDFAALSLADALGIDAPDVTIRDVIAGRATRRDAIATGPSGVSVVSGGNSAAPDPEPERLAAFIDGFDAFDVVVCDTGHPFSDATASALDVADGVVSTPDDAARRNTATLHKSLREGDGAPLLGTVLTRVGDASASEGWDCELLASIPESDAVASGASFALDLPDDPASVAYRALASDVVDRLRTGPGSFSADRGLWLSPPADPFITPNSTMVSSEDDVNSGALDEQTHSTERDEAVETSAAAVSVDSPETDSPESEEGEDADSGEDGADGEDESGIKLTRRGALAAITAAIGGVSAGILNTNETPEIEAFGYGGAPVSSNESATANATNGTTSAGSLPTTGINQTESTNETGPAGAEADPTGNETETGDAGNTTVSTNNTNTTAANEELAPETEPEPEDGETEPSPTNGGGGTTGDGGTDDGGGSDSGTETEGETDGGDSTTEEPADGQFGSVGYGQGGYGGVA
jgi:MinD-like ATPase involved in chromosome partitioning or flagellar assembly